MTDWLHDARCRGRAELDGIFFAEEAQLAKIAEAKAFCQLCPARSDCLAFALDNGLDFGVFGGMTALERRQSRAQQILEARRT